MKSGPGYLCRHLRKKAAEQERDYISREEWEEEKRQRRKRLLMILAGVGGAAAVGGLGYLGYRAAQGNPLTLEDLKSFGVESDSVLNL